MTKQEMQKLQEERAQMDQVLEEMLKEQQHNCSVLGQEYYKKVNDEAELLISDLAPYVDVVKEAEIRIAKFKDDMATIDKAMQEPIDNICPHCGKLMETEARFCSACGTPLDTTGIQAEVKKENVCRNCGNILKPEARFCGKCGTATV